VEVYGPLIYRFCRRRGLQNADARDVVQNVFVAVRRGIARFEYDPGRGRFRSWLGTITSREIGKYRRRLERAGQGDGGGTGTPDARDNDAVWIVEFNGHVLQAALDRIRSEFAADIWAAFECVWIENRTPAEAAARFQRKPDWVYRSKYRILQRLKAELSFLTADMPSFSKD
jgi:RNA polymerase sigma-70 factor (ECF subfamily)